MIRTLVIAHGGLGAAALIGALLSPDRTVAAVLLLAGVVALGSGVSLVLRVRRMDFSSAPPPLSEHQRHWFVARAVLLGAALPGVVVLVLSFVGVLPREIAPWVFALLVVVSATLDVLRLIEAVRAPTRPSVWWLIGYLPLPVLLIAVGVFLIAYPAAWIALVFGVGWGMTLVLLWTRARRKPAPTER